MLAGALAGAFRRQADFCRFFDAPLTALVCDAAVGALDDSSATGRAILGWDGEPMADALMMRFTGGCNALVRSGRAPAMAALYPPAPLPGLPAMTAALRAALADPTLDADLLTWLGGPPQTNEVGRAGGLFPGVMAVVAACAGLPVRLHELGASAGLNLNMARFGYRLGALRAGDATSGVQLAPVWSGAAPPLAEVRVLSRAGVDISPLDVADPAVRQRLMAFVWPDQPARVARAEAAIALACAEPPPLTRADAAVWAEQVVRPEPGSIAIVYHSIAHQYFPPATQARLAAHMMRAGAGASAEAPLAWLRYEMDDPAAPQLPTLRLTLWRGGEPEERLLARVHPHGSTVQWL